LHQSTSWCELGECWSHGQTERPADYVAKQPKKSHVAKKKGATATKGKGKGAAGGGWMWVPAGAQMGMMKGGGKGGVQQHHLKQTSSGGDTNPKGVLSTALCMLLGRSVTKEDCVYEVTEEKGKHVATLTVSALTTEKTDFEGKPAADKKSAEANAAKKALNVLSKEIKEAKAAHDVVKKEKEQAFREKKKAKLAEKKAAKEAEA